MKLDETNERLKSFLEDSGFEVLQVLEQDLGQPILSANQVTRGQPDRCCGIVTRDRQGSDPDVAGRNGCPAHPGSVRDSLSI